jgi:Flp pilus assembly protein CpaB
MEMEFKDTGRRRRVLLIVLGAALALAAGWGAFMLASRGGPAQETPRKAVLVAARDITARTQITGDDVTVREVPIDEALPQSYDLPEDVVGRTTSVPIYADQQMTPNLFATTAADAEFSILEPDETVTETSPYWRAVAVQIPADRAVGGEIQPGQHVDLLISVQIDVLTLDEEGNYVQTDTASQEGFQSGKSTKITIQDLEVLKATPDDEMYLLKVDVKQAEEIAHVIQVAPDSMSLVLRPDEDTRPVDTADLGTTTDRLVMTYLFPAPQLIDLSQLLGPGASPGASPIPGGSPSESPQPSGSPDPDASPTPAESPEPSATPGS